MTPAPGEIALFEFARGISTNLTSDRVRHAYPVWSLDGGRIVYSSERDGRVAAAEPTHHGSAELAGRFEEMNSRREHPANVPLTVVVNCTAGLKP
jgi:hypothetical protein